MEQEEPRRLVRRQRAASLGIPVATIAQTVAAAVSGVDAAYIVHVAGEVEAVTLAGVEVVCAVAGCGVNRAGAGVGGRGLVAHVVERADVGVVQRRERPGFALEAREPLRIGGKGPGLGNDQFAGEIDNVFLDIGA